MAVIAMAIPLLPGKMAEWRTVVAELNGPRRAEFDAARRRQGVTRQRNWLQSTPQGDLEILYMETDDPAQTFQRIATSEEPFDRWSRAFVLEYYGVDLSQPMTGPAPELILDWSAEQTPAASAR